MLTATINLPLMLALAHELRGVVAALADLLSLTILITIVDKLHSFDIFIFLCFLLAARFNRFIQP